MVTDQFRCEKIMSLEDKEDVKINIDGAPDNEEDPLARSAILKPHWFGSKGV